MYKHSLYINLLTWQLLNIDLSSNSTLLSIFSEIVRSINWIILEDSFKVTTNDQQTIYHSFLIPPHAFGF